MPLRRSRLRTVRVGRIITVATEPPKLRCPGTRKGGAGDRGDDFKSNVMPEAERWLLRPLLPDSYTTAASSPALFWNDLTLSHTLRSPPAPPPPLRVELWGS